MQELPACVLHDRVELLVRDLQMAKQVRPNDSEEKMRRSVRMSSISTKEMMNAGQWISMFWM